MAVHLDPHCGSISLKPSLKSHFHKTKCCGDGFSSRNLSVSLTISLSLDLLVFKSLDHSVFTSLDLSVYFLSLE